MSSCDGAASVVCVSVCKLFCGNRYYDATNSSIATKLTQDGQQVGAHPYCAQGRGQCFCADHENRFLSQANGLIATKLALDGPQVRLHPGCAQGQGQGQRSRASGSFVLARKTLLLQGKWPDCDQACTRWSPGQRAYRVCPVSRSRSKVT